MTEIAVKVQNVSKTYLLGQKSGSFRENVTQNLQSYFSKKNRVQKEYNALLDINFEIQKGEKIGIIGRNGAGKSTLLKILSRITKPSTGKIIIDGRTSSLLEVGTGFHPELTGRQNIFLNGAIMGMSKAEIKAKFDEIIEFSGVGKFIDTPVKRYSSGMYVRLAFAVAAHLEPEILIIDEVLAVGDNEFQKKCLGKMQDISSQGRTIIFVSHNMAAIKNLTQKVILLEKGKVAYFGPTNEGIDRYMASSMKDSLIWKASKKNNKPIQILNAEITSELDGIQYPASFQLDINKDIKVTIEFEVRESIKNSVIAVILHAGDGAQLFSSHDSDSDSSLSEKRETGHFKSTVIIPKGWLSKGKYSIRLGSGIALTEIYDSIEELSFEMIDINNDISRRDKDGSYFHPTLPWTSIKSTNT